MPLSENSPAPNFTLPSTAGDNFNLPDLKGQPLILYFYPKDFTTVCTKEACEFRDQFAFFRNQQIQVWGISRDSIETHARFRQAYKLPFHLLADEQGNVAKLYKAIIPVIGVTRRITYLLDRDHNIVGVFEKMFGHEEHIQQMVAKVQEGMVG